MNISFSKKFLETLLIFKNNKSDLTHELLSMILENVSEIDFNLLDKILYEDHENVPPKKERLKKIKTILKQSFFWEFYKENEIICTKMYDEKKNLKIEGAWRLKLKKERLEVKSKKGPIFQFVEKEEKKEISQRNCEFRILDYVRRRDDLVNPQRITYINFTNRIKPPIYKIIKEKFYNIKDSTQRLPFITDYSYDSEEDWEDCEDAETISSEESLINSEQEEEDDWLESDSTQIEKISKTIVYSELELITVEIREADFSKSIRRRDILNEDEKNIIRSVRNKNEKNWIVSLADEFWVFKATISKFLKEEEKLKD